MKRPKQPLQAQAGDSLPFALIVLAIGALLVGTLMFRTSSSMKLLETFDTTLRAQYSSDAGAEHALWQIANTTLRQALVASQGTPQYIDVPVAVNAIIPTVQAVCVITAAGGYAGIPECGDGPEGVCPDCADLTPTIYVNEDKIIVCEDCPGKDQKYKGELWGTDGNDVIMGTDGADEIYGYGGDDIICGLGGKDELHAGAGNDVLCGGPGNDRLYGGPDHDVLCGGDDKDELDGGPGNDVLCGGDGKDKLLGGEGDDRLDGGLGDDKLYGEDDIDTCCNGESQWDCEGASCEEGVVIYGLFDIQSAAQGITSTVRISETVSGETKVKAWHSEASD